MRELKWKIQNTREGAKCMNSFKWQIIVLFAIFILWTGAGYLFRDTLLVESALVVATIFMAGFVAYQAWATIVMAQQAQEQVKQMIRQAQLTQRSMEEMQKQVAIMGETLMEMKKDRMRIEELKDSLVSYIQYLIKALNASSPNYVLVEKPYPYFYKRYRTRIGTSLSPSEEGWVWRISKFIERLLEKKGFSLDELEEYNGMIAKFKKPGTPREEKHRLAAELEKKSKEMRQIAEDIFHEIKEMGEYAFEREIMANRC
ncbi:hypothetical protein [Thermococcus pacificus]|uniref:Uncharacterized protein n=1 Tax=Thermococcus pacificus TaxID=71998 RepID=A0A218P8V5_9EURY|nr:hypothetical protein [Thermococcus pacificus]ASJ07209.1 hypothetical protein A3L08_07700 [Thermococcus pacificus]